MGQRVTNTLFKHKRSKSPPSKDCLKFLRQRGKRVGGGIWEYRLKRPAYECVSLDPNSDEFAAIAERFKT